MKKGKIWGTTELLFCNKNVAVHILDIKKDGYCSKHLHHCKSNIFAGRTDGNQARSLSSI